MAIRLFLAETTMRYRVPKQRWDKKYAASSTVIVHLKQVAMNLVRETGSENFSLLPYDVIFSSLSLLQPLCETVVAKRPGNSATQNAGSCVRIKDNSIQCSVVTIHLAKVHVAKVHVAKVHLDKVIPSRCLTCKLLSKVVFRVVLRTS